MAYVRVYMHLCFIVTLYVYTIYKREINHQAKNISALHTLDVLLSLDSKAHQEINTKDTEQPPVTLNSNANTMDLSFLLCPSGMM